MTATRLPVLACDWHDCTQHLSRAGHVRQLRRHAAGEGWAYHDRRDWCPAHAELLGVRDGRGLPPTPMPAALAATVDPAKAGPGPHDTPAALRARLSEET